MRLLSISLFATLLSAPAFAADLGTYRPGTPYSSTVAAGADVCDNQCAGDAQCRGWNYVKPNPKASGICEFLSSVSAPIASQISISGESTSATPFSSRVTTGSTNTIRVGTQPAPRSNTVRVGQSPSGRRVVRQAVPKSTQPQRLAPTDVQNMSLTEQQNRYRQGQAATQVKAAAPIMRQPTQAPRQMFRPILDAPSRQVRGQRMTPPQAQAVQRQAPRRATGPRRVQAPYAGQGTATPQFQDPRLQRPQTHSQARPPQPMMHRGSSRPPIGQPIPAAQPPARPQPMTPGQRLAQLKAQAQTSPGAILATGPVALSPQQAQKSLFGRLNDDVNAAPNAMPTARAVPTQPVAEQPLGEVLAGGL